MFYYAAQQLLYILCGTNTNGDHYLYAYSTSGAEQCLITIPAAVGMSRVDGFTISADDSTAYIADSQGPIYADTTGMLGGSIYAMTWTNPCGCDSSGSCTSSTASWTPTVTNTITIDAAAADISDGAGIDDYFRNSGVLLSANGLSVFATNGVHPVYPGDVSSYYPKSLLKLSLADGSVEQKWSYTAATLGHDVDMEALTCGPDACSDFLYAGDEWNFIYQIELSVADPAAAVVREWDLSAIVDSTSYGIIPTDKGIESLTYSADTGYFYVGVQMISTVFVVDLAGAESAPVPSPTAAPVVEPSSSSTTHPTASTVPSIVSASSCEDLEWGNTATYGSSEVCGESDLNLGGCSGEVTWREAVAFCESGGARLCSSAELQADEARSTGCGTDSSYLWTRDTCAGGFTLAYGSTSRGTGTICESGSKLYSVRCCADSRAPTSAPVLAPTEAPLPKPTPAPTMHPVLPPTDFPVPIPSPSPTSQPIFNPTKVPFPAPSPPPTSRPVFNPTMAPVPSPTPPPTFGPTVATVPVSVSASYCEDLGWANAAAYGSSAVCGESDLNLGGCSGEVTWREAVAFCESGGARLCSSAEIQADETRSTGCGIDRSML